MKIWNHLESELKRRESQGLRRFLRAVPEGALDLAANDYLGLSHHPEVIEAAQQAAAKFGTGARASRLVSGHFSLVEELESGIARFKKCEASLVFSSGYAANMGVITALANSQTAIFCHKRNHASLLDACRFAQSSGATLRYFESNQKLRALLQNSPFPQKMIIVDGVFSMDGDVCDLPAILSLAREFDALILLDDAHGTGTLGATGRGTTEHFGLHDERIVCIGTLSKTLGSQGGFVAGPQVLIDFLLNSSRSFVYSTGLNPPAVGAALKALQMIQREPELVNRCRANARFLAAKLGGLGFEARLQPSPILPVLLRDSKCALELSQKLLENGLWCPAIRPPTVPSARLRIGVSARWNDADLACIVTGFSAVN
ncbi:glycine C-acetyltransferase/8-amino-7-oxononanoate synthase [Abditibacterium utsteinense]|uniref:Glycine C-acetyltransferase/8-amino-7-oxononanoate synthase n=1 Tax=Abditibacterium utsteinense TaxID=1960156 RepID=A0A2S8SS86_9BACT|nr:8-amino-7-oxononanoate synthase [Abditibacterium utsteinense]PQV63638.1 glycine C-acetyltransferase/8-amino-7-oxononanoate synthase [Abditibacterium utsteinense]